MINIDYSHRNFTVSVINRNCLAKIKLLIWNWCAFFCLFRIAALKNIGEKTTSLFERKKKEVGDLATEKATEAQTYAEEQAKKVEESIEQTKKEAGEIMGGTGD